MKKIKYIVITILLLITITNININVEAKQITHKTKIQTTTNKKQKNDLSIYSNNAILYNLLSAKLPPDTLQLLNSHLIKQRSKSKYSITY